MYLTQIFGKKIYGVILNDIALMVNWTSLYALYKSMKNDVGFREVRELAKDLRVDEKAISDVQFPEHFDLSYQADVWGMNFHEALEGFKGKVGLVYGGNSKICTRQRVDEAKTLFLICNRLRSLMLVTQPLLILQSAGLFNLKWVFNLLTVTSIERHPFLIPQLFFLAQRVFYFVNLHLTNPKKSQLRLG